jgi:pyrroloquinoline quinone biosynthesis protein B
MQMKIFKKSIWPALFSIFVCSNIFASTDSLPSIIILGIAQDAGYPQAGCHDICCTAAWSAPEKKRLVTSLAIIDPKENKWWLFEATPDIKEQLHLFEKLTNSTYPFLPEGIFLTHGHMGHYSGLMQLGREALNSKNLSVYSMPRMQQFLTDNGPWSQLVTLNNISLKPITDKDIINISSIIKVSPFLVPHRDEYTETVGFNISIRSKKVLFIPDIDKWEKFDKDINKLVEASDLALLDATFYQEGEIKGRAMSEIPHPFVTESMNRFSSLKASDKKKVFFIHFNHSNPLLQKKSNAYENVIGNGFQIAEQGHKINFSK